LVQNQNLRFYQIIERKHLWEVCEVIPPTKIVFNWKYAEYCSDSYVLFELFKEVNFTRPILTDVVLENSAEDIPEFEK
jgi:hypothetical protein